MPYKDKDDPRYREHRKRRVKAVQEWRRRLKRKAILAMGGKCQCCGYSRSDKALQFHHLDPSTKEFGMGQVRAAPRKIEKVADELEKCVLVCSNCHAEIHDGLRDVPETFQRFDRSVFLVSQLRSAPQKKERRRQKTVTKEVKPRVDLRKILVTDAEFVVSLEQFGGNKSAMARALAVSETAIRKRLKRILQVGSGSGLNSNPVDQNTVESIPTLDDGYRVDVGQEHSDPRTVVNSGQRRAL